MTHTDAGWSARLAPYRIPDDRRAIIEVALTVVPFIALWIASALLANHSILLALLVSAAAAGFLLRLFLLQHDCGHGALFTSRFWNDWTGRILGVATLTPYDYWRLAHARHHAGSGNLDRRGIGDIDTLTTDEYAALEPRRRLLYRLYRHPLVMFGLGPAYLFGIQHRLPPQAHKLGPASIWSVHATNLGIAACLAILFSVMGVTQFLVVHLPMVLIAATAGVWLFYVQHQFEGTHWSRTGNWSHDTSAIAGSSYYDLPKPLMWLTGNIGIHHLHHLSSRIPFYRLPQVLKDYPELGAATRLTLWQSLASARLSLWDEGRQKLISFREFRRLSKEGQRVGPG